MKAGTLQKWRSFFAGKAYMALVFCLLLLAHTTVFIGERALFGGYQEFLFGGMLAILLYIGCFVCDDLRFLILPAMSFVFLVPVEHSPNVPYHSRFYIEPLPLTLTIVLGVLLVAGIVWFCIRNRNRAKSIPVRDPVFISMLIFCGALFLNGIFSSYYTVSDTVFPISFVLSVPVIYALFAVYTRFDETVFDYFMGCLLTTGLLISAELLLAYFTGGICFENGSVVKESVLLGWGVWTAIGGMLSMLMPACFYFAHSHKHGWIFYLLGLLEYGCIFLSQSRGAFLIGTFILFLCLMKICVDGKNRKCNRNLTACLFALGAVAVILLSGKLMVILRNLTNVQLADNGRFKIWAAGWKNFCDYPVFGAGFYKSFIIEGWPKEVYPYLYHNTLIQMLASGGLVAFGAYFYHRFITARMAFGKPNTGKTFLTIAILSLLLTSLLDVLFFNTYPTIIYSLMLLMMQKRTEELQCKGMI